MVVIVSYSSQLVILVIHVSYLWWSGNFQGRWKIVVHSDVHMGYQYRDETWNGDVQTYTKVKTDQSVRKKPIWTFAQAMISQTPLLNSHWDWYMQIDEPFWGSQHIRKDIINRTTFPSHSPSWPKQMAQTRSFFCDLKIFRFFLAAFFSHRSWHWPGVQCRCGRSIQSERAFHLQKQGPLRREGSDGNRH